MSVEISHAIILIIVAYAILVGGIIMLLLYRTNRRIQLRQYPTPHTPIGEDANQAMKEEIAAELQRVSEIKVQPRFLTVEGQEGESGGDDDLNHRMIAVDSMRSLDRMIVEILPSWQKQKQMSVREFLYLLSRPMAPLGQVPDVCAALVDSYERARYGSESYNENEKKVFIDTLMDLINRLSILDTEDFAEGPTSTQFDKEDILHWLQTPGQLPEFSSLARSGSSHRRSDLTIPETRDLIDLSPSDASHPDDQAGIEDRPTSLDVS